MGVIKHFSSSSNDFNNSKGYDDCGGFDSKSIRFTPSPEV